VKAARLYGAGDLRVEEVPDPRIEDDRDALVRVVRSCICGSDLWPYREMEPSASGRAIGHEAVGVVEAVGKAVEWIRPGQLVVMPFAFSDGSCELCRRGLQTACVNGGFFGNEQINGAQAEALRVPYADGTLFPLAVEPDPEILPDLLTLSDVMGTGHYACVVAGVAPGKTVAIVGDGAVGLCGVIAAKRLGAERILLLGHHPQRTALGLELGATDTVEERGEAAIERVRELTGGRMVDCVLECVGNAEAARTAVELARPGGAVGRVGVPHYSELPLAEETFYRNVVIGGGPAPTRAFIPELLPDVLARRIEPGRVFDLTVPLDGTADGYQAMDRRQAIKVLIEP